MYETDARLAAEASRSQQVPDAVQSLDHLSAGVMSAVEELQRRLVPVLRDEPTRATGDEKKAEQAMVPLAHSISCSCRILRSTKESIESILDRLEL